MVKKFQKPKNLKNLEKKITLFSNKKNKKETNAVFLALLFEEIIF